MREEIKAKENKVAGGGPEHWKIKYIGKNPYYEGYDYAIVDTLTGNWIGSDGAEYEEGTYAVCVSQAIAQDALIKCQDIVRISGVQEPDYLIMSQPWIAPPGYRDINGNL